jgi:cell division protein FtsB
MKVNLGVWDTLTRVVIFLLFIAGILLVGIWYLPLIKQNERMRAKILKLDDQIREQEETARQMKNSMDALRREPKAVERLARETFGYAKTGEVVIRFEQPVTNPATHR